MPEAKLAHLHHPRGPTQTLSSCGHIVRANSFQKQNVRENSRDVKAVSSKILNATTTQPVEIVSESLYTAPTGLNPANDVKGPYSKTPS